MRVPQITIRINTPMSAQEAATITEKIHHALVDLISLVVEAYERRAAAALGYSSWDDFIAGEFSQAPLWLSRDAGAAMTRFLRKCSMSRAKGTAPQRSLDVAAPQRSLDAGIGSPELARGAQGLREYLGGQGAGTVGRDVSTGPAGALRANDLAQAAQHLQAYLESDSVLSPATRNRLEGAALALAAAGADDAASAISDLVDGVTESTPAPL